ncbi:hypothetical protein I6F07_17585 [Ensifer sp. IC4062]|nr:hypothetical protein [Ensifer sp. IC4062]MCA1441994.1 hypothetical protein [Ensifer sp. IC4062]
MLAECPQENCTVSTTGQCLLNNEPATRCPHYKVLSEALDSSSDEELLSEPEQNPTFGSSNTLTEDRLSQIMGSRYCTLVAIIGPPDSGKTAALVSIYLLLSHGRLHGFEYADSRSLMAFDEISRGARRWTGGTPPQQMTAHTELSDERAAGFLHLRIRGSHDNVPVDFLLPDLPGEWSTAMVEESRHDRLAFIERADVIWLMVDGGRLSNLSQRQGAIHRTKLYLQRLKQFFPTLPRIILVVTRADMGVVSEKTLGAILNEGAALGIDITVQAISSFSMNPDVPAGTGIAELIKASIGKHSEAPEFWPSLEGEGIGRAIENVVRGSVEV